MSVPPREPAGDPERAPLDLIVERLRLPRGTANKLVHFGMLVAVSFLAAQLIAPGLKSQQIPELLAEDVGRPFRAASAAGFKASRDYEIIDEAATQRRSEEARAAVRPVYDHNPAVHAESRAALADAFSHARQVIARQEAAQRDAAGAGEGGQTAPGRGGEPSGPGVVPAPRSVEAALGELRPELEQRLLGTSSSPLDDDDFRALVRARFQPEIEQGVLSLLERAYAQPVAASREELSREGAGGVTLRDLRDRSEAQRHPAPPSVLDVREVKGELDRFASVPGNLLPESSATLRRAALRLGKRLVRPSLTINTAETDARRVRAAQGVKQAVIQVKKGQKVIGDGELIDEGHLLLLSGMRAQTRTLDAFQLQFGTAGLVALLIAAAYAFFRVAYRRFRPSRKDALLLAGLLLGLLALATLWIGVGDAIHDRYPQIPAEAIYYCIPVAAGAALVRFVLIESMALALALTLSALMGVMLGGSVSFGVYALIASLVMADQISRATDRLGVFKAGGVTGAVCGAAVLFLGLAEGKGLGPETWISAGFAVVGTAVAVPLVVLALTPLAEAVFGYASDMRLLDLANLNHPALKELIVQAPGTYHHSIVVGNLVENAAHAIGANALLARSCAYYHDIGKVKNPLYFPENQKGLGRHDALAPAMSAVIIKRHVTDGIDLARQFRLPKLVADAIPQHHGTRLVGHFYDKALREQAGKENPQPVDESIYRYPGPKPQFREAALVMIANTVEAACRALPEPTTSKLQAQVQQVINLIFAEGQLDECDLTLRDLNRIAQSFLESLEEVYHTRPTLPPGRIGAGKEPTARSAVLALTRPSPGGAEKDDKRTAGS